MRHRLRAALVALAIAGLPPQGQPLAGWWPQVQAEDPTQFAAGFDKFFMHDECTGQYPPQPDTCAQERLHEKSFAKCRTPSRPIG
jgi:hypothetical protein